MLCLMASAVAQYLGNINKNCLSNAPASNLGIWESYRFWSSNSISLLPCFPQATTTAKDAAEQNCHIILPSDAGASSHRLTRGQEPHTLNTAGNIRYHEDQSQRQLQSISFTMEA